MRCFLFCTCKSLIKKKTKKHKKKRESTNEPTNLKKIKGLGKVYLTVGLIPIERIGNVEEKECRTKNREKITLYMQIDSYER